MTASNSGRVGRSRARRDLLGPLVGAMLCAAGFALGAAPVQAQDPGPKPALPPAAPLSILPPTAPAPSDGPPEAEPAPREPSVDVGDLAAPGVDRIGLVDTAAGGFSAQLWQGTDLELLRQVMPRLPRRMISPAQRRLAQNLFLSPGIPPKPMARSGDVRTDSQPNEPLSASQWLLESRVTMLAGLGAWADVLALLDLVPADQMTEGLRRTKAEANLVTNHVNATCAQTQAALNVSPETYWQRIQVFCQLQADQSSAAGLGLALLREQRLEDPAFFWAVEVLGGAQPPLPASVTRLDALQFAMLRKAEATLPANIADVQAKILDPVTLAWLAALVPADPVVIKGDKTPEAVKRERRRAQEEARILLAERAVAAGTLEAEGLRAVYRKTNIKDPAPPPLTQLAAGDARGRALLFQSALLQTVPAARAEVIALALNLVRADRGAKGPDLTVMGRAYEQMLSDMTPTSDLVWFAGTAARGLLAAGVPAKAKAWLDLARNMARTSREAGQVADSLWPLERLLGARDGDAFPPQALRDWAAALPAATPAESIAMARESLLSLLSAVGEPVTAADWLPVVGGPAKTEGGRLLAPYLWNGLDLAAQSRRTGETAILALLALGEEGPARTATTSLQQIIAALRTAGREGDARALAVEAALVLGL